MTGGQYRQFCRDMATLLTYPDASTPATAAACAALLRDLCPAAGTLLDDFLSFLGSHPASRLEEIYTATFDLSPTCYPYVGYQLCGESQKRTLLLIKLQQLYREHGFAAGGELADHLATLLRFVAEVDDRQCQEDIVQDALLPALERMLTQAEHAVNPYIQLLQVVRLVLSPNAAAATMPPVELRRKEVCS
jgi:nitrate reductase delta subunit